MKKSIKKTIALAMFGAILCSTVAACKERERDTGKTTENTSSTKETVTLRVFSELCSTTGEQKGWIAKILLDKFNVKLEYVDNGELFSEEDAKTSDIIVFGGQSTYKEAVLNNLLYDFDKDALITEHGRYIYDNMKYALKKNRNITSEITGGASDTLYGIGHNVATSANDTEGCFLTWDIRWDLYKELNYPTVNNLDDMVNVLNDMQKLCPKDENGNKTYGVSLWSDWDDDSNYLVGVNGLVMAYFGYDTFSMGYYDSQTGDYYDTLKEDGPYLKCLEFYNKLNRLGLLDPDSSTQKYDEYHNKMLAGNSLWTVYDYAGSLLYNEVHMESNKMMCTLVPKDATVAVYGLSREGGNRFWTISATTKYPELCMDVINWFATPEGTMTINYGPQGLCWDYDEDGYTYLTEFGKKAYYDRFVSMEGEYAETGTFDEGCLKLNNTLATIYAHNPDSNGETFLLDNWKSEQKDAVCDMEADWREHTNALSVDDYVEKTGINIIPATSFEYDEKSEDFADKFEAVSDMIIEYSWKAINAKDEVAYTNAIEEMKENALTAGYADVVEWALDQAEKRYEKEIDLTK